MNVQRKVIAVLGILIFANLAGVAAESTPLAAQDAVVKEICRLEDSWQAAEVRKDGAAVGQLLAEGFLFTAPDGTLLSRSQLIQVVSTSKTEHIAEVGSNYQVKVYENTAVIHGIVTVVDRVEGAVHTERLRWTDTWVKQADGRWRCVAAQSAPYPWTGTGMMKPLDPREQPVQTTRLVVRQFTPDDWKALQQLAIDMKNTGGDRYDTAWPTDDKGAQEMARWCVGQQCFAVCMKEGGKLIGFVRFNSIDDKGQLDLGHMFHSRYRGEGYASEALRPLLAVAFTDPKVNSIVARNAVEWPGQLTPLIELGFRAKGGPVGSIGGLMELTRAEWEASGLETTQ